MKLKILFDKQVWKVLPSMPSSWGLAGHVSIEGSETICNRGTFPKWVILISHLISLQNILFLIMPVNTDRTNKYQTHFLRYHDNS
jgi:hypothetical protein